jgi:hypothetical protein
MRLRAEDSESSWRLVHFLCVRISGATKWRGPSACGCLGSLCNDVQMQLWILIIFQVPTDASGLGYQL